MSFNPKIQRLERICSYPQGTGQFDARLDRLEKRLRVQPEDAQYERRIERLNAIIDEEFSPHSYSGDIVSFETLFKHMLTEAKVTIEPIQSGSGDPSPTNVRPISGHTGATLWDDPKHGGTIVWNQHSANNRTVGQVYGMNFSITDGKFVLDGTPNYTNTKAQFRATIEDESVPAGHKVLISTGNANVGAARLQGGSVTYSANESNIVATESGSVYDIVAQVNITSGTAFHAEGYLQIFDLTQMFGSTIADYIYSLEQSTAGAGVTWFRKLFPKPYYAYNAGEDSCVSKVNGDPYREYPVYFWQTVYGGTFDFVSGKLVIAWKSITADGVNVKVTGGYGAGGALWLPSIILATADKGQSTSQGNIVSSYLIVPSNVQTTENSVAFGNGGAIIVLHIGTMQGTDGTHGYNSASEVQAAVNSYLQSNPLQIVYKLATPIEIDLDPTEVETLIGTNNVCSDAGALTIKFN